MENHSRSPSFSGHFIHAKSAKRLRGFYNPRRRFSSIPPILRYGEKSYIPKQSDGHVPAHPTIHEWAIEVFHLIRHLLRKCHLPLKGKVFCAEITFPLCQETQSAKNRCFTGWPSKDLLKMSKICLPHEIGGRDGGRVFRQLIAAARPFAGQHARAVLWRLLGQKAENALVVVKLHRRQVG